MHMKISESKVFHRFLFKRSIPKLAGEQTLLSKIFIYYDNKMAPFISYTHRLNYHCGSQVETASTQTAILNVPLSAYKTIFVFHS